MNAAIDRTLTVPSFQVGHRHRASLGLTLAGGKGINVARALKLLNYPVVATGLAGGRTGTRVVEELTSEAILNDFVRIGDESRTSTAVVDPTANMYTEINEWGPHVEPDELEILLEKLHYLSRGAEAVEPLRLGVEAEPFLVSPNQQETEALVGQELYEQDDFVMAVDTVAELGARNVLVSQETGCYALLREQRKPERLYAEAPRVEPVSVVGAGDVLLAAFLAGRLEGRPSEDALRLAVAAATASTLAVGARKPDPRGAGRPLQHGEGEEAAPGL